MQWKAGNEGRSLKAPLLVGGEENFVGDKPPAEKTEGNEEITKKDVAWTPKKGVTKSKGKKEAKKGGDAVWTKDTNPTPTGALPQAKKSEGILSKVLDVVVGPDVENYGFILASLELSDERHIKQLNKAMPKTGTPTNTNKVVFKKLFSTGYTKSVVPFAGDANPIGDIAALGVGVIVRDNVWGPDLLEDATDRDENYWQIIKAAQEMAINVVFIFIRHKDSAELEDNMVCHPKFKKLAKGPWPQKQPYVFLMSYWGRFNTKQMEVIKTCMGIKDPLQVKLTINQLVTKEIPSNLSLMVSTPEPSAAQEKKPQEKKAASQGGNVVTQFLNSLTNEDKGMPRAVASSSSGMSEKNRRFKKQLLKKNKKQMMLFMAAEMHEMRERDKQFSALDAEVKELRATVARLQEQVGGGKGEKELLVHH